MFPIPIAIGLNVIKNGGAGLIAGYETQTMDRLGLLTMEEAFGGRIIVTVSPTIHTAPQSVSAQDPSIFLREHCEPRSEWTITSVGIFRLQSAIIKASQTRSFFMRVEAEQPITRREKNPQTLPDTASLHRYEYS